MRRSAAWLIFPATWFALASLAVPAARTAPAVMPPAQETPAAELPRPAADPAPTPVLPTTKQVGDFLASGVVIVVSIREQRMHVFRDGELWRTSPVSTGKRGKETPAGTFAILQKKKFHRSNLYSNAPMPFMQRLTWDGIAIHAGRLPGYPASHGCIRLPHAFATELFSVTDYTTTAVIVTDEGIADEAAALRLARASDDVVPIDPALLMSRETRWATAKAKPPTRVTGAKAPVARSGADGPVREGQGQTIQLAAALSADEASAHWQRLLRARPELSQMDVEIVPAVVNSRRYFRLRATAPGAHGLCADLKRSGFDCFAVS